MVTRFDYPTVEGSLHWGGTTIHSISHRSSFLDSAFIDFVTDPNYDPYSNLIHNYDWNANTSWLIINNIHYTNATPYPDAFDKFLEPPLLFNSSLRTAPVSSFADEVDRSDTSGKLNNPATLTVRPNSTMLNRFLNLNMAAAESLKAIQGLSWNVLFQPLSSSMLTNVSNKPRTDTVLLPLILGYRLSPKLPYFVSRRSGL